MLPDFGRNRRGDSAWVESIMDVGVRLVERVNRHNSLRFETINLREHPVRRKRGATAWQPGS